ncbi:hypothetical protein I7I48_01029 [Histoplasma ohiense]|nr:hypothetical protein I7I48_01029 [Histoplasma ohiense (nom. inval.)]
MFSFCAVRKTHLGSPPDTLVMQMYDMANGRGGGKQGISVFGPILLSYAHGRTQGFLLGYWISPRL